MAQLRPEAGRLRWICIGQKMDGWHWVKHREELLIQENVHDAFNALTEIGLCWHRLLSVQQQNILIQNRSHYGAKDRPAPITTRQEEKKRRSQVCCCRNRRPVYLEQAFKISPSNHLTTLPVCLCSLGNEQIFKHSGKLDEFATSKAQSCSFSLHQVSSFHRRA